MPDLTDHLRSRIRVEGPLTVAQFMEECLGHPRHGYYMTRDPLGVAGDFTTAPEISQMFGELLGLWTAVVWQSMGSPPTLHLVELGPGRGTLMADALRAGAKAPGFVEAVSMHLVETSPVLRARQKETLAAAHPGLEPQWWNDLSQVPPGPMVVLANEFFDALPVRQFMRTADGWCERLVALNTETDSLCFEQSPPRPAVDAIPPALASMPAGSLVEVCPAGLRRAHTLARRLAASPEDAPGAALIIDYGHPTSAAGDTLQALRGHQYQHPLSEPGKADLTAHVDFQQLSEACAEAGAAVHGLREQGAFLKSLGIEARAAALAETASDEQRQEIGAAFDRLTGDEQMGKLFKVMAVTSPGLSVPPGFE